MADSQEFQADPPPERPEPRPRARARRRDDDDRFRQPDDPVSTMIPYKNPQALIAYYCGVFGLIPCLGAILGPVAIILGILGLRYVKTHPTAKGTGHAITGIVLGSIDLLYHLVVVCGVLIYAFAMAR